MRGPFASKLGMMVHFQQLDLSVMQNDWIVIPQGHISHISWTVALFGGKLDTDPIMSCEQSGFLFFRPFSNKCLFLVTSELKSLLQPDLAMHIIP